ncbi:iron-containing alcohol dehydrogenase [Streptomyces sp. S.PB5]|uniref:iron-containing alcohol dehydrogenase n=1 Tax=Streptomyces sp. S.PB5 TaxID=3020844 RepID=UPI00339D9278
MKGEALEFTYRAQPMRVLFRSGAVPDAVCDEVALLGLGRVLVLCDDHGLDTARAVAASLGDACAGLHAGAVAHVPVEVADLAVETAREARADGCVAVGGGSVTGLAKAVALRTGLPIVAVPTTYAGSEMTPVWGLTEGAVKRTGRDPKVLPRSVVYDERLGIPRSLAELGLTAADVDRAVEVALGAPYANPRPASADDLRTVLHAAWAGEPPYGG